MKVLTWLVVFAIIGGVTVQLYNLYRSNTELDKRLRDARAEALDLGKQKDQLQADMEYYSDPENLAKELKAQFDYRRPGEKLIKIQ